MHNFILSQFENDLMFHTKRILLILLIVKVAVKEKFKLVKGHSTLLDCSKLVQGEMGIKTRETKTNLSLITTLALDFCINTYNAKPERDLEASLDKNSPKQQSNYFSMAVFPLVHSSCWLS